MVFRAGIDGLRSLFCKVMCLQYQPYFFWTLQVLTYPDWSQESLKPTLTIIMRRLEKVFTKVLKKSFIRVS